MFSGFESEFPIDLLGRYRLVGKIGSGSMGVVFHAVDTNLEKDVAIKTLYRGTDDRKRFMRFQKEAKAIGRLEHPNIVRVLDFGVTKSGGAYMVMDFVDGKSLNAFMTEEPCASEISTMLSIFHQICTGIHHAHQNGVIHRDLKATNIMVEMRPEQPTVRIIDFGVAQLLTVDERIGFESTGTILGSPAYMSPESSRGEGDSRSDVYSLGCVLFECLTGRIPFIADSNLEVARLHSEQPPPRLRDLVANYDEDWNELQNLLDKCMAKNPQDRYQSVAELIDAVEKVAESILEVELSSGFDELVNVQVSQQISKRLWKSYPKNRKTKERSILILGAAALSIGSMVMTLLWCNEESQEQRGAAFTVGKRTSEEVSGQQERIKWADSVLKSAARSDNQEWTDETIAKMKTNHNPDLNLRDSLVTNAGIKQLKTVPLRTADLSWSQVTDEGVMELARKAPNLLILKLDGLKIGDASIEKIKNMPLLEIGLRDTEVSDTGLELLGSIKTLTRLKLDSCQNITDGGVKHLVDVPGLSDIGFCRSPITTRHLSDMKNLEHLFIGHVPCNDADLERLSSLSKLKYLEITASGITGNSISAFLKFPCLEWVGVASCKNLSSADRQKICKQYFKRWRHPLVLEEHVPYHMIRAVNEAYRGAGLISPSQSR